MNSNETFELLVNEALEDVKSFRGWDFSHLTDARRMIDAPLRWNYITKVKPYLDGIAAILDIGTAGGEVLSKLSPLPEETYATEDYPPNVALAREILGPLGVKVIGIEPEKEPPSANFSSIPGISTWSSTATPAVLSGRFTGF